MPNNNLLLLAILGAGAFFATVSWWITRALGQRAYTDALKALATIARSGHLESEPPRSGEPPGVAQVRVLLEDWAARMGAERGDDMMVPLSQVVSYLEDAVARPLMLGRQEGDSAFKERVDEALDALEDLQFYTGSVLGQLQPQKLGLALQDVTREYAGESGVLVKLRGPAKPMDARLDLEAFQDALYLLLSNAGRFGTGHSVDVEVRNEGAECRILIRDHGPGFTPEALQRAMDPFFTTDPGALGLGLTHARGIIEAHGGRVWIRNREKGGGEVEISIPLVT